MPGDRMPAKSLGLSIYNPKLRSFLAQSLLFIVVVLLFAALISNVIDNLARNRITSGFGFFHSIAGFDISQTLISVFDRNRDLCPALSWWAYSITLLISILGIVLATMLGFVIGTARLSSNWLIAKVAGGYVELIRNIPLLLQLLFWYNAVLKALPEFTNSLMVPGGGFLNSRGLFLAKPTIGTGILWVVATLAAAIVATVALRLYSNRRRDRTGNRRAARAAGDRAVLPCAGRCRAHLGLSGGMDLPATRAISTSAAGSKFSLSSWPCCSGL